MLSIFLFVAVVLSSTGGEEVVLGKQRLAVQLLYPLHKTSGQGLLL